MKPVFTRIEATNYRCFKEVNQPLNPFEILVGPNGSGKSTFLDVIGFLSDFASDGLETAVERRTENFRDLVYGRSGADFYLVVDVKGSEECLPPGYTTIRYDVGFHLDAATDKFLILPHDMDLIPDETATLADRPDHLTILSTSFPVDRSRFPAAACLEALLHEGVRIVALETSAMKAPSPAGSAGRKIITGAGLARLIANLKSQRPKLFRDWLSHVQTALPEIRDVESIPREWENTRYVMVQYQDGVQVPSWMLSEGTLRLLQLTILAYFPDFHGVYLVEEPENGVHPSALETIYQSLSSIQDAQVLVSSHSPILLNMAEPKQLLCFSKSPDGVKIVRGDEHPALRDWRNEVSLGTLAASGILG